MTFMLVKKDIILMKRTNMYDITVTLVNGINDNNSNVKDFWIRNNTLGLELEEGCYKSYPLNNVIMYEVKELKQ